MSTVKTANYVLVQDFTYINSERNSHTLPAGSFVYPVTMRWAPKHIKDEVSFNPATDTLCYTKHGFVVIPLKFLRVAD
jgi:hypothetical protein